MKDLEKKTCRIGLVQAEPVLFDKQASLEKSLEYIFYKSLVYYSAKQNIERFFRIGDLISVLDKDTLSELKTDLDCSCEEFYKLTEAAEKISAESVPFLRRINQ